MTWLMVYGSVAVAVLAVVSLCGARALRGDFSRLLAGAAAAVLWPVMVVGLVQYGAIRLFAAYLRRRSAAPTPLVVEPEPATAPLDLVESLARFAQQVGATRPA